LPLEVKEERIGKPENMAAETKREENSSHLQYWNLIYEKMYEEHLL
jgi:hypothetical protein